MGDLLHLLRKGGAISPQSINDLWAWNDPSDLTTVTESAGNVSQLNDKSSNQFNVVQATEINKPFDEATLGGKKVLSFSIGGLNGSQWLDNQNISGILNGVDQSFTTF